MKQDKILLSHGAGGRQMQDLISDLFVKYFSNALLDELDDSAVLPDDIHDGDIVFTTDSYVVNPIFFPRGDIGKLFRYWDRWHRVTVYGDVKEPLAEFAKGLGLKVIEEA